MAIRLGDKPLTNAEKQKRFRERRKAAGLVRHDAWLTEQVFSQNPARMADGRL